MEGMVTAQDERYGELFDVEKEAAAQGNVADFAALA